MSLYKSSKQNTTFVIVTGNLIYKEIPTVLQKMFKNDLGAIKTDSNVTNQK